jgi:hypothetical protein
MIAADVIDRARAVRLEDELSRRGIKLRGGVDRCGPCPVCGGTDRFSINVKKQLWRCRICPAGGDVIARVRHLNGLSFGEAITLLTGHAPERTDCSIAKQPAQSVKKSDDSRALAQWLWEGRRLISEDCPAARGHQGAFPATLGYLPPNGKHPPAMIAAFGFCEEPEPGVIDAPVTVTGVHITRLTPDGRKAPEEKSWLAQCLVCRLCWRRSMTGSGLRSQRGSRTG